MMQTIPIQSAPVSEMSQQTTAQPPQMLLMQMITSYWVAQSIYAAATLGIADHLKNGEKHCNELAVLTSTNGQSLYRLLRALASVGIFAETNPGCFAMTPLAELLRSDVPGSLRDVSIMMGDREHYNAWGNILHCIRTDESAFENLFGTNIFEHYTRHPEPAMVFDRAMTSFSRVEIAAMVAEYDYTPIRTLVDVAGGQGSLLLAILKNNPGMQGILFDLPAVIDRAIPGIEASGMGDRCQQVTGSFFETLPAGADAYLLKHIIHDWDDARAIAILRQCAQAMADNGRVLVVEQVIPPGNDPFIGKLLDVNMLVMCPGGKERTAEEYRDLFDAAGLQLTRIVPTQGIVSIIEGVRK